MKTISSIKLVCQHHYQSPNGTNSWDYFYASADYVLGDFEYEIRPEEAREYINSEDLSYLIKGGTIRCFQNPITQYFSMDRY